MIETARVIETARDHWEVIDGGQLLGTYPTKVMAERRVEQRRQYLEDRQPLSLAEVKGTAGWYLVQEIEAGKFESVGPATYRSRDEARAARRRAARRSESEAAIVEAEIRADVAAEEKANQELSRELSEIGFTSAEIESILGA